MKRLIALILAMGFAGALAANARAADWGCGLNSFADPGAYYRQYLGAWGVGAGWQVGGYCPAPVYTNPNYTNFYPSYNYDPYRYYGGYYNNPAYGGYYGSYPWYGRYHRPYPYHNYYPAPTYRYNYPFYSQRWGQGAYYGSRPQWGGGWHGSRHNWGGGWSGGHRWNIGGGSSHHRR